MSITKNLRRQHKEILEIGEKIQKLLKSYQINKEIDDILSLISDLEGKLKLHLTIEDDLYNRLANDKDIKISEKAKKIINEWGEYKTEVFEYSKKWPTKTLIENRLTEFIDETKNLLNVIYKRIPAEENEIFLLIEKQSEL